MRRLLYAFLLVVVSIPAVAQERVEVIPLHHRLAEQVLPVLQPLMTRGVAITASGNKLLVRGDPASIRQVHAILDEIDTDPRRLVISVRSGSAEEGHIAGFTGRGGVVANPDGVSVFGGGAGYSDHDRRRESGVQSVQALEDSDAYIYVGRSLPLPMTRTLYGPGGVVVARSTEYMDVGTGFTARASLIGNRVTVMISPQRGRMTGGVIDGVSMSSSVNGNIGEWIRLGGVSMDRQGRSGGIPGFNTGRRSQVDELWIKVEALD